MRLAPLSFELRIVLRPGSSHMRVFATTRGQAGSARLVREGASEGGEIRPSRRRMKLGNSCLQVRWVSRCGFLFDNTSNLAAAGIVRYPLSSREQASAYQRQGVQYAPTPASDGENQYSGRSIIPNALGGWAAYIPLAHCGWCVISSLRRAITRTLGQRDPSQDLSDLDLTMSDPYELSGQVWAAMVLLYLPHQARTGPTSLNSYRRATDGDRG